jgi:5'-3' exonuclease
MGIIADTFAAQLADLKQRSEETDKQMLEGLARMKAMVNEMAEDKPVSDEEMIAEAILLLKEHGYTVIAPTA